MSIGGEWLGAAEFGALAGLTRQGAGKALRYALREGRAWRGARLEVRPVFGRGGRSGLSYQVSLSSLSEALEAPLNDTPWPDFGEAVSREITDPDAGLGERVELVRTVLQHQERTRARAAAADNAATRAGVSVRTIERWIADYQRSGIAGLCRRKPANAGKARVVVSRPFDSAFRAGGYPEAELARLGQRVEANLKGLWASPTEIAGWAQVQWLAEELLREDCEAAGFALAKASFRLSRRHVERFADFRIVNVMRTDRKRFDDNKPRIRRDWTGIAPMDWVVADVHPVDVYLSRPDGSLATAKMIGFMDGGTGRIFHHLVMLAKGEGIRQEHVTEAFLAMVAHPEWGFPRRLYLDNGSEFSHLTKLKPALKLVNEDGARTIIFAKPYNASAKPIENLFGRLERSVFSLLPGYVGGDRMKKRTANVGRAPVPYPGSFEAFRDQVDLLMRGWHDRPVGGQWANKSPNAWFAAKVAAGHRPSVIEPLVIDCLFSDRETRRVEKGGVINVKGGRWTHPTLAALPARSVVQLALPWRRGEAPLFQAPGEGWAYLSRELALPADWIEGAHESHRRQKAHAQNVRKMVKTAPALDAAMIAGRLAERSRRAVMPRPDIAIDAGAQLAELAQAKALPPPAPVALPDDGLTDFQRRTARLLRTEKKVA